MSHSDGRFEPTEARDALARELQLVSSAVSAVANGASSRITLANLRFGEELVPEARRMARELGLRVRPLFTSDERGVDLVVERDAT